MSNRFSLALAIAGALAPSMLVSTPAFSQDAARLEVPSQPLSEALRALGNQTRTNILFDPAAVRHLEAPAVTNAANVEEALAKMLVGSGLTYRFIDGRTVTLIPADGSLARKTSAAAPGNIPSDRIHLAAAENPPVPAEVPEQGDTATVSQLEEIVVTATKRQERIQDIPLSISVVTASEIGLRGLVSAEDYLRGMPGVNQTDSNVGASIVIRGLETTSSFQGFGSGNTVATYFGETSITNSSGVIGGAGADIKLVDMERVEVLRGPQGTAFGSSSLGGVVRNIPVAPSLEGFEGRLAAGSSFTSGTGGDNQQYEAVVGIPLIRDRLAIRVVGYRFNDTGYYRNVAGTDAVLQTTATGFGAQSFARNQEHAGDTTFTGGRIAALFQASDDLKFTFTYLKQDTEVDGWVGSNRTGYDQAILRVAPESRVRGLSKAGQDYEIGLANATMEYDIGWADVVATYSHIDGESAQAFPFSARPSGVLQLPMVTASFSDHEENSGEVRLATRFEGAWNFLAGLYAEQLDDYWEQPVYWYGNPAASTVPLTPVNGDQLFSGAAQWLELEQRAAFSEVSWQFLPDFTLTGGVRYYDYERTVRDSSIITGASSTLDPSEASGSNFRGNLSYKPSEDALIYVGWSQGFRLGKPQAGLSTTPTCDANGDGIVDGTNLSVESTKDIQSDSVDSYEIGAKFTLLDRLTISGDVFRATWDDIPVQVQQACGAVSIGYTANAGRARSEGIEIQASYNLTQALRVDAGASWIRAELIEDVPFQGFRDGDRLPSPKTNASLSLQYKFTLAGRQAYWRADSIYVGGFYSTVGNRIARNAAGDYVKLDTSLRLPVSTLNVDLFVHNLLDADDTTYVLNNNTALRLRPRTIGFRVGYDF